MPRKLDRMVCPKCGRKAYSTVSGRRMRTVWIARRGQSALTLVPHYTPKVNGMRAVCNG